MLLLGQNDEPYISQWQHENGQREEIQLQACAWGSDLDGLVELARHGSGLVIAPDFCAVGVRGQIGGMAGPTREPGLQDMLPGWRLLAGLDTVQALSLPLPAGSETARALIRFVRSALTAPGSA